MGLTARINSDMTTYYGKLTDLRTYEETFKIFTAAPKPKDQRMTD